MTAESTTVLSPPKRLAAPLLAVTALVAMDHWQQEQAATSLAGYLAYVETVT